MEEIKVGEYARTEEGEIFRVIEQEVDGKIIVNNKPIGIDLKQVDYSEVETGALFNSIFALNISELTKDIPSGFPFDYVKPYIPEVFYISSTVNVCSFSPPVELTG